MATRSMDLATWPMPRRRSNPELDGIPGTVPGTGLRVRRRKTRVMGLTGLGIFPPRVHEETEHRGFVEMPTQCGKCKGPHLIFEREIGTDGPPRRVHCHTCGWDTFFVMASRAKIPVLTVPVETGQSRRRMEVLPVENIDRRVRKIGTAKPRRRGIWP